MFNSVRASRQDQSKKLNHEIAWLAIVAALVAFHFGGAVMLGAFASAGKVVIPNPLLLVIVGVTGFALWRFRKPTTPDGKRVFWVIFIWMALWALAVCVFGAAPARAGTPCEKDGGIAASLGENPKMVYCRDGVFFARYANAAIVHLPDGATVVLYDDNWTNVVVAGVARQYDPDNVLRSARDGGGKTVFGVWHAEPLIDPR